MQHETRYFVEEHVTDPIQPLDAARFSPEKMAKCTLARGEGMMVGLNCFLPGQEHALHSHEGQDKLYHVLEGTGSFQVGDETLVLQPGQQVFVPGGVPHGAKNDTDEKLVVMAILAPPPPPK